MYCDTDEEVQGHGEEAEEEEGSPSTIRLFKDAESVVWRNHRFGVISAGIRAGWARRKRREVEVVEEYRRQDLPRRA